MALSSDLSLRSNFLNSLSLVFILGESSNPLGGWTISWWWFSLLLTLLSGSSVVTISTSLPQWRQWTWNLTYLLQCWTNIKILCRSKYKYIWLETLTFSITVSLDLNLLFSSSVILRVAHEESSPSVIQLLTPTSFNWHKDAMILLVNDLFWLKNTKNQTNKSLKV